MSVLNHLGQAAAMLLILELLVLIFLMLAVAGGLAFGLYWARGKTGWAFSKVDTLVAKGRQYLDLGLDYAARPAIVASAFVERAKQAALAVRRRVRAIDAAREAIGQTQPFPPIIPSPDTLTREPLPDTATAEPLPRL